MILIKLFLDIYQQDGWTKHCIERSFQKPVRLLNQLPKSATGLYLRALAGKRLGKRALVFGVAYAWMVMLGVFLFDLLVSRRGWCVHLCPVGAFYSLLGTHSLVRVSAANRNQCDDCMECFAVCPEPQVIMPALRGADKNIGPMIKDSNCTNCGRCIDICSKNVFRFDQRFHVDVAQRRRPALPRRAGEGEPPAAAGGG